MWCFVAWHTGSPPGDYPQAPDQAVDGAGNRFRRNPTQADRNLGRFDRCARFDGSGTVLCTVLVLTIWCPSNLTCVSRQEGRALIMSRSLVVFGKVAALGVGIALTLTLALTSPAEAGEEHCCNHMECESATSCVRLRWNDCQTGSSGPYPNCQTSSCFLPGGSCDGGEN